MWIQYFLNKDSVTFSAGFQYRAVNISEYLCVLNAAGIQKPKISPCISLLVIITKSILGEDRMLVYIFQFFCPFTQKNQLRVQ